MSDIKEITIVTHCYAKALPQYAEHLSIQLRSVSQWRPERFNVCIVVCCTSDDDAVYRAVNSWRENHRWPGQRVQQLILPPGMLYRRAIGRDMATKTGTADVFWFTDADYFFGPGCIDSLYDLDPQSTLTHPRTTWISEDHATGDKWLEDHKEPTRALSLEGFKERRQKLAIGGCQIVGGYTARKYGYLRGTRWETPVDPAAGFRSCRCDRAYRGWLEKKTGTPATPRDVPSVYRIRHGEDGRDYNEQGEKQGKKAW